MASWDCNVSIACTFQNLGKRNTLSGYFFAFSFMSTVNSDLFIYLFCPILFFTYYIVEKKAILDASSLSRPCWSRPAYTFLFPSCSYPANSVLSACPASLSHPNQPVPQPCLGWFLSAPLHLFLQISARICLRSSGYEPL